ncbi:MAG: hypothetical protein ABIT71_07990, partial [Vicinamibacteraceae bacterium]
MTDTSSTSPGTLAPGMAASPAVRRRGGSLRRRLPLVISLFLVVIVGAGGTAAYLTVRQSVLDAARTRLLTNARQWGQILSQGMAQRVEEARRAAAHPALQRRLGSADPATVADAQRQLWALLTAAPQNMSAELWSASGERLMEAVAGAGGDGPGFPPGTAFEPPRAAGLMPLQARGDLIYTEHVTEVKPAGPDASRRGFLVFRRRAASPAGGQAVARLIGAGNGLRMGSRASGVWTDLGKRVDAPPSAPAGQIVSFRRADGSGWLGTEVPVANTPFALWAETPESVALGPAHTFWNAMLPIGALFV